MSYGSMRVRQRRISDKRRSLEVIADLMIFRVWRFRGDSRVFDILGLRVCNCRLRERAKDISRFDFSCSGAKFEDNGFFQLGKLYFTPVDFKVGFFLLWFKI